MSGKYSLALGGAAAEHAETSPLRGTSSNWVAAAAELPIGEVLDAVGSALDSPGRVVLQAPPGAGKTTVVPLALLDAPWRDGTIVVLEPRRLAVRAAAERMAWLLGESVGGRIGWRMRHDTKVSTATEIEVVTEGTFTRRVQRDPALDGVAAVIFDEFHERSLDADLGLALTLDLATGLRPDLRIAIMSATLETDPVAALLDAPVVRSAGRSHPLEIIYLDADRRPGSDHRDVEPVVVGAVHRALRHHHGDVLVFLPGAGEIERVRSALGSPGVDVDVRPLYAALAPADQDAAIRPAPSGRRKVVLASAIAETSVTIDGVSVVIDAGLRRAPRLDAGSGMTRLVTQPVTQAEADQRAGRAGRLEPGTVYRLWSRHQHRALRAQSEPEIEVADLAPLALELAAWGAPTEALAWLTPPPPGHLAAGRDLLRRLGALDDRGSITDHGRALVALPLHPRLAHMVLAGADAGQGALAADLAAVINEPKLAARRHTDVADRLRALSASANTNRSAQDRARRDARRWRNLVGAPGRPGGASDERAGFVLGLGFPDRLGQARPGQRGEFLLSGGGGAFVAATDALADTPFVCAAELDGASARARVFLGAPLTEDDVRAIAGDELDESVEMGWDVAGGDVVARRVERFGALVLSQAPAPDGPVDGYTDALLEGIRRHGIDLFAWSDDVLDLQARLGFLHRLDPRRWPAVDDATLVAQADKRLRPFLGGCRRRRDLAAIDGHQILLAGLGWDQRRELDTLAPSRLQVPSGRSHRVDYSQDPPVLAVKLQELFGSTATPTVGNGAVAVLLHLLSPAGRPLQITQDLVSFWSGPYASVRADMRGRYPKHPWPDDPTTALPSARPKRRR